MYLYLYLRYISKVSSPTLARINKWWSTISGLLCVFRPEDAPEHARQERPQDLSALQVRGVRGGVRLRARAQGTRLGDLL